MSLIALNNANKRFEFASEIKLKFKFNKSK